jgi:hypothetical protein
MVDHRDHPECGRVHGRDVVCAAGRYATAHATINRRIEARKARMH